MFRRQYIWTIIRPVSPQCCGCSYLTSFFRGGDIHVATDGNFHHRHKTSAGDSPPFYDPTYILPKEQVDAVGRRIDAARKRPAKSFTRKVPDEAVDECECIYEAADGNKQKASMNSFDDTGWMALVCRHDIPLFFANIDTPGEQQKYSVALLEHLFSLLPPNATVGGLYDVGCVLDRSLSLVSNPSSVYGYEC
jgi:Kyakuja-Dileera-Zisupton transposase